jgi:ABC-2 type transport system permease protein
MMRLLRAYRQVASIAMQEAMIYRWNMFLQGFVGLVPLFITVMWWRAMYVARGNAPPMAGFERNDMTSYFIYIMLVHQFTSTFLVDYDVAWSIRNGHLNKYLIKPIDFPFYRWIYHSANRVVFCLFLILPMIVGIVLLRNYIRLPGDWRHVVILLTMLIPIALISYLISFCIGMIAFWMLEISSLFWIFYSVRFILSGGMFPLALLPRPLEVIIGCLPFQLTANFPASLLLGKLSWPQVLKGVMSAVVWIILLSLFARFLWRRGLRRYDAAGM